MEHYAISRLQANFLAMFSPDGQSTLYELATSLRMTPSEIYEVAQLSSEMGIMTVSEDRRLFSLTDKGFEIRRVLEQQDRQRQSQSAPQVVIEIEDEGVKSEELRILEEMDEESLDKAIEAEMSRLQEEASTI